MIMKNWVSILGLVLVNTGAFAQTAESHLEEVTVRKWRLAASLGVDTRVQKQVNPEYNEPASKMLWTVMFQYSSWGLAAEYSSEQSRSNDGLYRIARESKTYSFWPSYEFETRSAWRPFLTVGWGRHIDQITSTYRAAAVERMGERDFWAAGAGLRVAVFSHWLFEGQVRAERAQDRPRVHPSFLISTGFIY